MWLVWHIYRSDMFTPVDKFQYLCKCLGNIWIFYMSVQLSDAATSKVGNIWIFTYRSKLRAPPYVY